MRIAIVPDKFKGCLTAEQVGGAMMQGVLDVNPQAQCYPFYLSDGGDGFLSAIKHYKPKLESISVTTVNALGEPITGSYLWDSTALTAYLELASASGLAMLDGEALDVVSASTYGTGLEILSAMDQGATHIVLGLGGSATNDLGLGIATALGYRLLDQEEKEIHPDLLSLKDVSRIEGPRSELSKLNWTVVNDVRNPLLGPKGATQVYGPQKGVTLQQLPLIEEQIGYMASLMEKGSGKSLRDIPGSGAAGGTAFGMMALFGAKSVQGTAFLMEIAGLDKLLLSGEISAVITGEGKLDSQTAYGKLIHGVVQQASKYAIPVGAICGTIEQGLDWRLLGLKSALAISALNPDPQYSFDHAATLIQNQTAVMIQQLFNH